MPNAGLLKDDKVLARLKSEVGEDTLILLQEALKIEIQTTADTLRACLSHADLRLFETTAHALKSAAASFGAMKLSDACRGLEFAAKEGADADRLESELRLFEAVVKETNKAFGFKNV